MRRKKTYIYPVEEFVELYKQGKTIIEISKMHKTAKDTVRQKLKEVINLRPRQSEKLKKTDDEIISKFKRIESSGCWEWQGYINNYGYGAFQHNGKHYMAHRYMYEKYIGEIGSLNVLHKCDNPKCANPAHLFLGTQSDNMKDCISKGRHSRFKTSHLNTSI
jgi:hypothetical protein